MWKRCDDLKSGVHQPVLLTLSLLRDEADQPIAIASIAKDITDRKHAELQCREAIERRDQFLAMLSHELRNPLGAVLNASLRSRSKLHDQALAARAPAK